MIAAHQRPDHATIARFIQRHEGALGDLFGEVLTLCAGAGLATVGVVAIDGTKARQRQPRPHDGLRAARAGDCRGAIATDAAETAEHGERRGDELPEIVATTHGRQGWLRAARQRLDAQRAKRGAPIARSRSERLLDAKRRLKEDLAAEHAANASYEAYHRRGLMKNGRRMGPSTIPKIEHRRIRAGRPTSNGHVERLQLTILEECWRRAFARSLVPKITALRHDLDDYLHHDNTDRAHTGRLTRARIPKDIVYGARKMGAAR